MTPFLADARFALRGMRKQPAQSALLVLTLAVGLAANATIFSSLDALVLRPLDFPNLPRLARLMETSPGTESFDRDNIAPANLLDWQAQAGGLFESLVALEGWDANLRGREVPERALGFKVSPRFFSALGISLPAGRGFLEEEGREGHDRRVVLGHELWQRSFGSDPGLVGQEVLVDGEAHTVVGIAPPGFRFPEAAELWAPLVLPPAGTAPRDVHTLGVFGLLAEGRSLDEAQAALAVVAQRLQEDHPVTNASRGVRVVSLQRGFEDVGLRPVLAIWQTAAVLVLLIACVNVANLVLARGAERQRELAVRLALGAQRRRLLRQLLTEGLVAALLAAAVALPLSALATREMRRHMPAEIARFVPGWSNMGLDLRTAAFTIALAVGAALLFTMVPAFRASRPRLTEALREGGRSGTAGARRQWGRNALVVAQVAGALALLVAAGLAVRSARAMLSGPQGFDPSGLLTLQVTLPDGRYREPQARRAFARSVSERLAELPGVAPVAYANVLPARGSNSSRVVRIEGEPLFDKSDPPQADARSVSIGYFSALRMPILAGRDLALADDEGAVPVAVVSRSFAERYWPGRDPLGRRFRPGAEDAPWVTVVGVCGDVIHQWFSRRNQPTYYRPYAQDPRIDIAFALRTAGDPEALATSARRAVTAVDPDQPAYDVYSMRRALALSTIGLQYVAAIMAAFGALAVALAVSGVYGVMSYRVSLRTREIGVRVALGASASDVLRLTLGQASALTGIGLVAGSGLGLAAARALETALMGAVELDPRTFAAFTAALAVAALVAAYVPARRALAVDPAQALRAE